MRILFTAAVTIAALVLLPVLFLSSTSDALGSAASLAIVRSSGTVCGVSSGPDTQSIHCASAGSPTSPAIPLLPNISFVSVSGGRDFLCGLRSGGAAFFCWNSPSSPSAVAKRVYNGSHDVADLAVGEDQIAAVDLGDSEIRWWRGGGKFPLSISGSYHSLTSGNGFSCAIGSDDTVRCWGPRGDGIQSLFSNLSMATIVAGDSHVCGLDTAGVLLCKGSNESGQSNPPSGPAFEFETLALGSNHTCAIRRSNGTLVCWGGGVTGGSEYYNPVSGSDFEFIVAGGNLTCGLTTTNYSVVCWGSDRNNLSVSILPLPRIIPGICVNQSSCNCGTYPDSENLCSGSGVICNRCDGKSSSPSPSPSPLSSMPSTSTKVSKRWIVFAIVGAIGGFAGISSIVYCLLFGICRHKKVHNSVQPTIAGGGANGAPGAGISSPFASPPGSKSRIFIRQGSRIMLRQRSGPSSSIRDHRAEEFTFAELAAATKDFAAETKIGAGSFGAVYKGKLPDGREVAIKRSESGPKTKKFQEKESAFQSELEFLSRLHHKHLVGLLGYCDEYEERLLVYEFMKHGALYDHLHPKDAAFASTILRSWKARIKILLDAARGIEYLHNYAVPPIIHRDIKSSNILLDANWAARVSDFGLSLMGPASENGHLTVKAAGTVGYMDPEYYGLHHLTSKSDVYGFGVVMLETLTGKRAIFKEEGEGNLVSVVDYALPSITAGEVRRVMDARAEAPGEREAEAVELVAYTAVHCVSLEGKERPAMSDVVANLETALALCEDSHESIDSSITISIGSASAD
ncbi:putative serine/threonine-protein kinase-like protein CCR3 [Typha angustifolia]|uniref:putative serine/threonine-protein kinase-like protein CCR3 n=1 Tax=Typha angustifolia TaxID=59011 RepID=UPI003C2CF23F